MSTEISENEIQTFEKLDNTSDTSNRLDVTYMNKLLATLSIADMRHDFHHAGEVTVETALDNINNMLADYESNFIANSGKTPEDKKEFNVIKKQVNEIIATLEEAEDKLTAQKLNKEEEKVQNWIQFGAEKRGNGKLCPTFSKGRKILNWIFEKSSANTLFPNLVKDFLHVDKILNKPLNYGYKIQLMNPVLLLIRETQKQSHIP